MHQQLANATFRIQCGPSRGSGFSFRSRRIIVTNFHVVAPHFASAQTVHAFAEDGTQFALRVLAHSPENQFDFAILEAPLDVGPERHVLQPDTSAVVQRGTKTIFAGFPHGVPDLLVHEAIVSGPAKPNGFYVDGSVNGGNSGGPIIDATSGLVVGIVTQRRFMGGIQLGQLRGQIAQLSQHCQAMAGSGQVVIMGVDFGKFAQMMTGGFSVIDQILQMNANSGIGIGFHILHVNTEFDRLRLR
jgi:S1-C subfamily serine protease